MWALAGEDAVGKIIQVLWRTAALQSLPLCNTATAFSPQQADQHTRLFEVMFMKASLSKYPLQYKKMCFTWEKKVSKPEQISLCRIYFLNHYILKLCQYVFFKVCTDG